METVLIPSARLADPFIPSDIGYLNEQLMLFGPKVVLSYLAKFKFTNECSKSNALLE